MPDKDHPDHEQLVAFQAGDVDRRERIDVEAHLAGCSSCAELVASVGRARGSLALLEEPDLPPGLHDRLAAAVSAEAEANPGSRVAGRAGSRRRERPGAAALVGAALVLSGLALLAVRAGAPHRVRARPVEAAA